ncbi:MAG: hypothetical protein KA314_05575 [Chloroflexi bacterium]|nr:hypothetical protein [Chloroflexota bacterium]MBP8055289.1 hypothetical protein [Chloroflexota bacterium]
MTFPALKLSDWQTTRDTVQRYCQLLGKIRRALTPFEEHWYHASLRVGAAGLTTTTIPYGEDSFYADDTFEMLLDFMSHKLSINSSRRLQLEIPLTGQSLQAFHGAVMEGLKTLGVEVELDHSLFADDTPGVYDAAAITAYWQALKQIDSILHQFKAGLAGETGPVQLWPHHFDLAMLWFSGRQVPNTNPNDRENADEQMNFGFSTGDGAIPDGYFYITAYPTPDGFVGSLLSEGAYWNPTGWKGAVLPYAELVGVDNPKQKLLNFLHLVQARGATLMQ